MRNSALKAALFHGLWLLLAACGDDDGALGPADAGTIDGALPPIDSGPEPEDGGSDDAGPEFECPAVCNLLPMALNQGACELSGELTEDGTLSADVEWFLEGGLQVGTAESIATLTIDAGTRIYGDATDAVDYLLVFPGSSLQANGTGANPIHFTSDDDGVDGSGEWGGVFLRGFEGLPTLSGTPGDNLLDYVVVAEAGANVAVTIDGNTVMYQDNLVLNGVDRNTRLTFVQSHNSARDGLHILNGDPRLAWILSTGSGRDGVWYRNFRGLIKDLLVIHDRDADGSRGRSGIYASETAEGDSNPRIVNATLVGRDGASASAAPGDAEFGLLFADNTDQIRLANVLIANFRHGCFSAESGADLSAIDTATPGPNYLDGVHCLNAAGPNPSFGIVRDAVGFPMGTVAPNNSLNRDGLVYYNGAVHRATFTGHVADRRANFTASWYLDNIGGVGNGLLADASFLNAFLDGDTNDDGVLDVADASSPFILADDGPDGFNQDVAEDTGGYDLTHVGAVRGGAVTNAQFDGWTVATGPDEGFVVQLDPERMGTSECPADLGGVTVDALPRAGGRNVCQLSGTFLRDATLTSNVEWQLEGGVVVGDALSSVTLTIQAGTRITGDATDAVDYLLVFPGSSLQANGTGARPIRFTSDDAGVDGSGEWGGVFLRGFEGLPTLSGTPGDSLLDYVVVAEGGAPASVTLDGNTVMYQDNLVLNGVDRNTRLTFVQSHNSARDGLHILNGDPRLSWILSTGSGRDGVWYRNFRGLIKDLLVIHDRDADGSRGRSGIYASETAEGDSNPRIVNATLMGRDGASVVAGPGEAEFGILFADDTDQVRMANVLIANFRHGCFSAESGADLSAIDTAIPGPNYLDGVHCLNEAGPNPSFGIVRDAVGFPMGTVAPNNSPLADGLVYYNGAGGALPTMNTPFFPERGGINFTGEITDRRNHFTAGWYLDNIRGVGNGLLGDAAFLNGFLDGDTNNDGVIEAIDARSPFIIADDGPEGFNQDVAADTGGYDLTHIGAVRGGAVTNVQFDFWTVDTHRASAFTIR